MVDSPKISNEESKNLILKPFEILRNLVQKFPRMKKNMWKNADCYSWQQLFTIRRNTLSGIDAFRWFRASFTASWLPSKKTVNLIFDQNYFSKISNSIVYLLKISAFTLALCGCKSSGFWSSERCCCGRSDTWNGQIKLASIFAENVNVRESRKLALLLFVEKC